jgi:LysM repeat protein
MKRRIIFACITAIALIGCAPATPEPTPEFKNLQTRIAATLAAIPTAESLTPTAPPATATPIAPPATATPQPAPTQAIAVQTDEYEVLPGDTLSTIAVKFNTSIAGIQLANNLSDARVLQAGQRIKIPTGKIAPDESTFWFVHMVQAGETYGTIAVSLGVQLSDLLRVNNITNAALVREGDRVVIPVRAPA